MTQLSPYHEIDLKALPTLACCDDPILRQLCSCGVRKIEFALPSSQTAPSIPTTSWADGGPDAADALRNWANTQFISGEAFMSVTRLAPTSVADQKPRKRHPATDIRRIEKTTGKRVTAVTLADDGRVVGYTFAEAPATDNQSESEADEALEEWKRKKNANQS